MLTTVEEINAWKTAIIEIIGAIAFIGIGIFFGLAMMGCFDHD